MRLTAVGTAGSLPAPDSAASCYLLRTDDSGNEHRALLDLGSGAFGPLQEHLPPHDLDAVLLSHLHPDHAADLCSLHIWLRYHPEVGTARHPAADGVPPRTPLYGPAGVLEHVGALLAARDTMGRLDPDATREDLADSFAAQTWSEGETLAVGPLNVTAARVAHSGQAFGLRIEHAGRILAYTGDSDLCPALFELARGADLLLSEATFLEDRDTLRGVHLTGRRAGQLATQAGVGRLVLTHVPVWTDPAAVLAEAAQVFDGPIDLARPGTHWTV